MRKALLKHQDTNASVDNRHRSAKQQLCTSHTSGGACMCRGAGLTEKNGDGKTPIDVAKLNEQDEITAMLQEQETEAYL